MTSEQTEPTEDGGVIALTPLQLGVILLVAVVILVLIRARRAR